MLFPRAVLHGTAEGRITLPFKTAFGRLEALGPSESPAIGCRLSPRGKTLR